MSVKDGVFTVVDVNNENDINVGQGSTITFDSINYYLNNDKCCNPCKLPFLKKPKKQILYDVKGIFKSGMNAIMGPTGCGKSSLLDILADRKDRQGLEGEILINGKRRDKNYKYSVGYVVQDDIVCGTLTVRENIMFSANVRLPTTMSLEEKQNTVNEVLSQLGLEKCADSAVGTEFKRGVSGGERKRTNIGMELVLSPIVLFLDEPTTGLDSSTARNVMECLHDLSRRDRTIIFSIHQPRYSIFKLFDTLFLIAAGRCAYHGPAKDVLTFFSTVGFVCEEHNNPADFMLDVLQSDASLTPNNESSDDDEKKNNQIEIYFNEEYEKSSYYESIVSQISQKSDSSKDKDEYTVKVVEKSRLNDFYYLSQRTIRNFFRNPLLIILQTGISIFLAVLVGLIYLKINHNEDTGVKNRTGAIFFIVTNQVFSNLSAIDLFIKERLLFVHENVSGYYHVFTYFLSKVLCDILPLRTVPAIVFSIIVYFMMGFQVLASKFFLFFFCVWMTSITASTLCFLVSATVENYGVGNLVAALFCVLTLIFSGFLVEISSVLGFLRWIQYFSIFRYSSNIMLINEFNGLTLCSANETSVCTIPGTDTLTKLNVKYETAWDFWKNFMALILIALGFLFLTYVQLRRFKKTK